MSDMRMAKYETLIEDIDSTIKKGEENVFAGIGKIAAAAIRGSLVDNSAGNTTLALIYDYGKCNDYAINIFNDRFSRV